MTTALEPSLSWTPPAVGSLEQTGLSQGFIVDMALKIMYFRGQVTATAIAETLRLPLTAVTPSLDFAKREQFCEVRGAGGLGVGTYQYVITSKGTTRARQQLEQSTYVGPAPVRWSEYVEALKAQGNGQIQVNEQAMVNALNHLVVDRDLLSMIGPAVNSGRSIFLYGPPGNGKTTIAESIGHLIIQGDLYIPYCVEVDGLIIKIFDEINHEPVEEKERPTAGTGILGTKPLEQDGRWIKIQRPVIMVGGELTLDGLELKFDQNSGYYEAPYQMKANGGMFLIDDFGRQQIRPRDLLNRWIVPMEKGVDFLGLHTGRKLEVPFELLLVFSTNLPPRDLVDEAFLRRIRHKIEIKSPTAEQYHLIFQRACKQYNIRYSENAVRYLLHEYYIKKNRKMRGNHPRDLIEQIIDIAAYLHVDPQLTRDLVDRAARSYFVDL